MALSSAPIATRASTPAPKTPEPRTDDEILGLDSRSAGLSRAESRGILPANFVGDGAHENRQLEAGATDVTAPPDPPAESESLRAALDANPDLRRAWDDAHAFRETFASPDEARAATAVLADIDRMDALFFSRRPEDHAELARAVAQLDPAAFASLAQAMHAQASRSAGILPATFVNSRENSPSSQTQISPSDLTPGRTNAAPDTYASPSINENRRQVRLRDPGGVHRDPETGDAGATPTQAESDFFHAANAAAVQSVLDSIETQVERLLPENISKSARNRVIGEIYRELDTTLRSNRQLAQQMRDALRSGSLDAEHQRAVVSLVTGRARQVLPGVAKRVLGEWTSTVVAAHNDRRARQQAAERRIDIAGANGTGSDGPRSMTPRDVDYKRMSDADILNL